MAKGLDYTRKLVVDLLEICEMIRNEKQVKVKLSCVMRAPMEKTQRYGRFS